MFTVDVKQKYNNTSEWKATGSAFHMLFQKYGCFMLELQYTYIDKCYNAGIINAVALRKANIMVAYPYNTMVAYYILYI